MTEILPEIEDIATKRTYKVAIFNNQWDTVPKIKEYTKDDLKALCATHNHKEKAKALRISLTAYKPGSPRGKANIEFLTGASLDIDDSKPIDAIITKLEELGLWYIIWTTTQHTPEEPRYRILVLFESPIIPVQWENTFDKINYHVCNGRADPAYRSDWSHLSNLPNCPVENVTDARIVFHDGADLNVDDLPELPPTTDKGTHSEQLTGTTGRGTAYAKKVLSGELEKLAAAPNNQRNIVLNNCALALGHWVGGGMFDRSEIERELESGAVAIGMKHTEDNILPTIKSGLDKGVSEPRKIPPPKNGYRGSAVFKDRNTSEGRSELAETSTDHGIVITKGFACNDIGNGERFAAMHTGRARYCHDWGGWAFYNDKRWINDQHEEIDRLAKITAQSIITEAMEEERENEREVLLKHAAATFRRAKRETMVKDAISEPRMSIKPQDFDKDLFLLNVLNGTIDLRTNRIRPHNPNDYITKLAPVIYDQQAECPFLQDFLMKVFEGDLYLIDFVQRVLGYALTGDISEQKIFVAHGEGSNGKSTFFQTIKLILGDYACETAPNTIMVQKHARMATDIADLHNVRLGVTTELNDIERMDEAKTKRMSGGEELTGERKYQHPFKFTPQFKLFLLTNHLPKIYGTDHAIWRRVVTIPFNARFWSPEDPEDTEHGPPEMRVDRKFPEKLKGEASGILNWLLEGCMKWQQNGLEIPDSISSMTRDYRQNQDILGRFIEDHCVVGKDFQTRSKHIYTAYNAWLESEGEEPVSSTTMGKQLKERGMVSKRTASERFWQGIRLREDCDRAE
jgi:putative DNA primase/helicase